MTRTGKEQILFNAFKQFGEDYIFELRKELNKNKKYATGNLMKSLESKVFEVASGFGHKYQVQILSEDYLINVDEGRRPGAELPKLQAISDWARVKGIPQSAVFPIAKSIAKNGIKPTNVTDNALRTVTRGTSFNDLEVNVNNYMDRAVEEVIDNFEFEVNKDKNIIIK